MAKDRLSGKLAVILHADVAGSTVLVQQDEQLAHQRIQDTFRRFGNLITRYHGRVQELRGDALLAEFERASDAVTAALAFQSEQVEFNKQLEDSIEPHVRVGIAMGEVVIADNTITGTGVVLAQRLEQISQPGGVVIQGAAYETIPGRFPFEYEDLGEHEVKGFENAVKVYAANIKRSSSIPQPGQLDKGNRKSVFTFVATILIVAGIALLWFKPWEVREEQASLERMAFELPDKPSIAVLPFTNMSADVEQEYFVDGMTEDLITDLSKLSELFVVARNTVFTYKGRAVKVHEVAEELGVRYVLEGSVRRSGDQVRINAQLIDALSGGHVWAERYDGVLNDVFALQDEVTRGIVAQLAINLSVEENTAINQIDTKNSLAHDLFLKGREHYRAGTKKDYSIAVELLKKALDEDPEYSRAKAALAAVYWNTLRLGWYQESLGIDYFKASELARVALRASQKNPTALTHQIASESIAFYARSPRRALAEAEAALKLDPNHPSGHLAMANALLKAKKSKEAERSVRTAMRLDPHYPAVYLVRLAQAQFQLAEYQDAARSLEKALAQNTDDHFAMVYLAATYGQLELIDKGKASLEQANSLRAKSGLGPITLLLTSEVGFRWQGKRSELKNGLRAIGAPTGGEWYGLVSGSHGNWKVDGVSNIDVKEAKSLHEQGVIFIDVFNHWYSKRIPGSHFLEFYREWPESGIFNEASLGNIAAKDQEIVLYNSSDRNNAAMASALAMSRGFERIYYLRGGLDAWMQAGYPVEKGKPKNTRK